MLTVLREEAMNSQLMKSKAYFSLITQRILFGQSVTSERKIFSSTWPRKPWIAPTKTARPKDRCSTRKEELSLKDVTTMRALTDLDLTSVELILNALEREPAQRMAGVKESQAAEHVCISLSNN